MLASIAALACILAPQTPLKEEITVNGMRLFACCWRTPTGNDPYMIWTIRSRDPAPAGYQWVIRGESLTFPNLPIQPVSPFTMPVTPRNPDEEGGPMVLQPGGEKAQVALIRGHLERVETLTESIPLPDLTIVKATKGAGDSFGPMYHLQIDKPIKVTTASGITVEIPKQGADTPMKYGAVTASPILAVYFHTNFEPAMESLLKSELFKKFGGPVEVEATLVGIEDSYSRGFVGRDYVVEAKGFGIKPGPVKGLHIDVMQTAVLESHPLDFRVPVRESKGGVQVFGGSGVRVFGY
jgi:hypothetical protein